jgi:RNA polymerase sigma factor for flagellar operon FliA
MLCSNTLRHNDLRLQLPVEIRWNISRARRGVPIAFVGAGRSGSAAPESTRTLSDGARTVIATSTATRRPSRAATTRDRSIAERDALINQHLGLVHHVARKLAAHLSTEADLDEMISAGTFGLLQAADAFDGTRGLSFSTFAVPRIRGAILDELRRQDHVPRNVRRRSRDLMRAREALTGTLQRQPTDVELSARMQVAPDVVRRWELDGEWASFASLDQPARHDAATSLADMLSDSDATTAEDALTQEREVERVKEAIMRLKDQERAVLALNFFEELRLPQIAEVLGVSVCRVSQIRSAALAKLRSTLTDLRAA